MPSVRVVQGAQEGQVFVLKPPGPYRIGRDPRSEFPLFDRGISRRHFRLDFRDQGYLLTDLGSLGGTYVNDRRVKTALLSGEDVIRAGQTRLVFEVDGGQDALVGKDLGGYRVLERVGRGGMGTVYRALQRALGRIVALKVLPSEIAENDTFAELFLKEARAAAKLSHANIVRVYDVAMIGGVLFYSMEFMAHGNVQDLLRRKGRLSVPQALAIALDVARAIEYAERVGVVHRDIKPANLLIHQTGAVKLGDLGIATTRGEPQPTSAPAGICGSPHYMAPEQALGREVDSRADIYSLGATLYQLLAGAPPFPMKNLKDILRAQIHKTPKPLGKVRPETPQHLTRVIEEMMAKNLQERPLSGQRLVAQLTAVSERVGGRDPLDVWRRRTVWAQRAALLLSIVAGVLLGFLLALLLLAG